MQASSDTEAIVDVRFNVRRVRCLKLTVLVAGLRALASGEEPSTSSTLNSYSRKGRAEGGSSVDVLCVRERGSDVTTHKTTYDSFMFRRLYFIFRIVIRRW